MDIKTKLQMNQSASKTYKKENIGLASPKTAISLLKKNLVGSSRSTKNLEKSAHSSEKTLRPLDNPSFKLKAKNPQNTSKASLKLGSPSSIQSLIKVYSSRTELKKNVRGVGVQSATHNNSAASLSHLNFSLKNSVILSPKQETVFPITPKIALTQFLSELSEYEKGEILEYPDIYYFGRGNCKIQPNPLGRNRGYDDDRADYYLIKGDHIAYRYEIVSLLGKGSFGQVCLCYDWKRHEQTALKIIRNKKKFHQQATVEIRVLKTLLENDLEDKNNIVRIRNYFIFRNHICMTFELLGFNLYELLKNNKYEGLSITLIRKFAIQLLVALKYIKDENIVHCDLKPENILLRSNDKAFIKVIDFGSSCFLNERVYTYIQSRFYRAPEIILGIPYTMAIDMWSFGCIMFELYTGQPLFPGESEHEQLILIMEVCGVPPNNVLEQSTKFDMFFSENNEPKIIPNKHGAMRYPGTKNLEQILNCQNEHFFDFIKRCLDFDPERRITPVEAMEHPWIMDSGQKSKKKIHLNRRPKN